jgi:hypothetical protein
MHTTAHHWSLFRSRWTQSTQVYHMSLRSILISSHRIGLSFLSGLFTPRFLTKICAFFTRVSRSQIPSLTWNTFQHIFMGSHLFYSWFIPTAVLCCIFLCYFPWILSSFDNFCLSHSGCAGHAHKGISALDRRAAYWHMLESGLLLSDAANATLFLIGFLPSAVPHWTERDTK